MARDDVDAIVRAVKARKAPAPRPDPVELDLGDGRTVQIRWERAGASDATQALRKVLKTLQDRDRTMNQTDPLPRLARGDTVAVMHGASAPVPAMPGAIGSIAMHGASPRDQGGRTACPS